MTGTRDHRVVSDLTWNTFRNHVILKYEIPKYDGDLGKPQSLRALDGGDLPRERSGSWRPHSRRSGTNTGSTRTRSGALMRLRGMESCAPDFHAEAFYARKIVLAP